MPERAGTQMRGRSTLASRITEKGGLYSNWVRKGARAEGVRDSYLYVSIPLSILYVLKLIRYPLQGGLGLCSARLNWHSIPGVCVEDFSMVLIQGVVGCRKIIRPTKIVL
jgi:hypothetical protein